MALLLVSAATLAMPAPGDIKAATNPGGLDAGAGANLGGFPGATDVKAVPGAINAKALPGSKAAADAKGAATEAKSGAALDRAVEANVEAQDYQE